MDFSKMTFTVRKNESNKLSVAFMRALEQGRGRDDARDAYEFTFHATTELDGQPFAGATITPICNLIYTARSNRAGVETMMGDDRVKSMELRRILFENAPKP